MTQRSQPELQNYTSYTEEDFAVWKILFDRQLKNLEGHVSLDFMESLEKIGFSPSRIPDFNHVNEFLQMQTGWSLHTVPCISPQQEFFRLLAEKKFTATCWIRRREELDYLEEPDMFHDVFAHTPLLSNAAYCEFFKGIGDLAMQHINNVKVIECLGRLYWFTIEFGMIYSNNEVKVFGAGVISSQGETRHALSNRPTKTDFNIEKIFSTDFRTDVMQDKYFVVDSFDQLTASMPIIKAEIERIVDDESHSR
ncbi:MAG: phenylalanine 4-monooxygenase [Flavobacteriales bacterium]|nr:phenylalanine 4-monooxygenase [Flavobacteriales bacterium]